tara:strand:- start:15742 stop:17481 length:1740 start_codon:yes stop_codon:yes gene_type:complete
MSVFSTDSLTTSAITDDDKHFRYPEGRNNASPEDYKKLPPDEVKAGEQDSLIDAEEITEWCASGLLLPIVTNLDTLDMAMIKSLITDQFAGDFFNMGGLPTFSKDQIRKSLASAIQMVSTSESKEATGADAVHDKAARERWLMRQSACGPESNTNLPTPNQFLVALLQSKGKQTKPGEEQKDREPLINEYGRPTTAAISMLSQFDQHLEKYDNGEKDKTKIQDPETVLKLITSVFGEPAPKETGPNQLTAAQEGITTVKLANALATARLAGNELDETILQRLKAEGYSKDESFDVFNEMSKDMLAERYAPEFIEIEGASSAVVMKALRRLQDAYTEPNSKYDDFRKRMTLVRRLLDGEDRIKPKKTKLKQEGEANGDLEEEQEGETSAKASDETNAKTSDETNAKTSDETNTKTVLENVGETLQNALGRSTNSKAKVKLPPLVQRQLVKLRDFQVGLGTKGIFELDLTKACHLQSIVTNSHYWLTSGMFVQSGAVGDFSHVCSVMISKLYNYDATGPYRISQVRSALSNAISDGPKKEKQDGGGRGTRKRQKGVRRSRRGKKAKRSMSRKNRRRKSRRR